LNITPRKPSNNQENPMNTSLAALALVAFMSLLVTACAAENGEGDYIKVEIKGTLQTGVMAIGAETTGTVVRVNNVTWELDLGGSKELQELAAKLDKKAVLVTGTYEKRKGVEIRERHIVKVATLKAAGEN
jgi:hypothetical protein